MTAEIVLMNRNGVAMAADSAVTIGEGMKIYNSANKLFSLSKTGQVGIMIYGNASFMNIPYETVIKVYRDLIYGNDFSRLEEYGQKFLEFLGKEQRFQNSYIETENIRSLAFNILKLVIDNAYATLNQRYGSVVPSDEVKLSVLESEFENYRNYVLNKNELESTQALSKERFNKLYKGEIDSLTYGMIGEIDRLNVYKEIMLDITYQYLRRDIFDFSSSGIVIAGYGTKDLLPRLVSYEVDGLYDKSLRYVKTNNLRVSPTVTDNPDESSGFIIPFAQQEMVHSFITGINPTLRNYIIKSVEDVFEQYPNLLKNYIEQYNIKIDINIDIIRVLRDLNNKIISGFKNEFYKDIDKNHVNPLINNLETLPKEELAEMAKALVNLTSLKRRVTSTNETVGGPVDVAIISKGDGFIWIERKHYFESEFNHSFFKNYFREEK